MFTCVHLCSFMFVVFTCVHLCSTCVHLCSTCVHLVSTCVHLCSTCVPLVFTCVHLCSLAFTCVHLCSFVFICVPLVWCFRLDPNLAYNLIFQYDCIFAPQNFHSINTSKSFVFAGNSAEFYAQFYSINT